MENMGTNDKTREKKAGQPCSQGRALDTQLEITF